MVRKYVYFFGPDGTDGNGAMRDLLGGKGADLAEMTRLGIPVPPGFTITTEACIEYFTNNQQYPPGIWEQLEEHLAKLEKAMGAKFGQKDHPLLVSVRSGARVSMPGMMDTVLNLGLNDDTLEGLIKVSNNPRFAYDSYRRFLTMFGNVVLGIEHNLFEEVLEEVKKRVAVKTDVELGANELKEIVKLYKELIRKQKGAPFPHDPKEQLKLAINAVFNSWNNQRAITYRRINNIPDEWGTAVNVQAMVFGNLGNDSATGVAFTRNPSTGENRFYGEYLMNAQGEDVVAGIRTPENIESLKEPLPGAYAELMRIYKKLENHYKDMQDIEFTIQKGRLYMLQTRRGKRTAAAAVRVAVEMVEEGLIDRNTAVLRVEPGQVDQLLHPMIDPKAKYQVIARGLPASPGAAVGKVVFTAEEAEKRASQGEKVVLVRQETSPEDIGGMNAAQGILTARGGMTSHAAVVARGMGKCCIVGCGDITIDEKEHRFSLNQSLVVKEGDVISLNGSTGDVILGPVKLVQPTLTGNFAKLMEWADEVRTIGIRANADTPHDAQVARDFGAQGIGLCRTEHMFFERDRILAVREMILADTKEEREKALAKILPMQKKDFREIFKVMDGLPVTIRLLDPPLHEFLPHTEEEIAKLAEEMRVSPEKLRHKVESLREMNPMLGHRGCRLGITYPEIYDMQSRAICEAACELLKEGYNVLPEIMIPLVGHVKELSVTRKNVERIAQQIMAEKGVNVSYLAGTMIELPRAALTADQIAREAEFFSFGTNDLTQTVYGLSRDDAANFLPFYVEHGLYPIDPFIAIDQEGVGQLMEIGVKKGRAVRPDLKIGICGEHGGEPSSINFCHSIGLNYVSCSPFRVPIARLAGAHAALQNKRRDG